MSQDEYNEAYHAGREDAFNEAIAICRANDARNAQNRINGYGAAECMGDIHARSVGLLTGVPKPCLDGTEWVLKQIVDALPSRRDWLDPSLEALARDRIRDAEARIRQRKEENDSRQTPGRD